MEPIAGQILALVILLWGFSLILRNLSPGHRSEAGHGSGCAIAILAPLVWWTIGLIGRIYHQSFLVFTEYLSGVHDWWSYRTSLFKHAGAVLAFFTFNGFLMCGIMLVSAAAVPTGGTVHGTPNPWVALAVTVAGTATCGFGSRQLLRRMP